MSKDNQNAKEPKVIGSKHYAQIHSQMSDLDAKNDISSLLFEQHKEEFKKELIKKYADIYKRALVSIEEWEKEIEELKKPDSVQFQKVTGTENDFVEVGIWKKERKEKLPRSIEKYDNLCKLFDKAYEESSTANYKALDTFLQKNKK